MKKTLLCFWLLASSSQAIAAEFSTTALLFPTKFEISAKSLFFSPRFGLAEDIESSDDS